MKRAASVAILLGIAALTLVRWLDDIPPAPAVVVEQPPVVEELREVASPSVTIAELPAAQTVVDAGRLPSVTVSSAKAHTPVIAGTLRVSVLDADGTPMAGAGLQLTARDLLAEDGGMFDDIVATAQTNQDGQFVFAGVSPGRYTMSATTPGPSGHDGDRRSLARRVSIRSSSSEQELNITFPPLFPFDGSVVDDLGKPVGDATVVLAAQGSGLGHETTARTDTDGRFVVSDAYTSRYEIKVIKAGYDTSRRTLHLPTDGPVALELPRSCTLTARVVSKDGLPVMRFTVEDAAFDSPSGRFSIDSRCAAGRLVIAAAGMATREVHVPFFRGLLEMGDIVLSPARTNIEGTVTDMTGVPLSGVAVNLLLPRPDDPRKLSFAMSEPVFTDASGRFLLDGVDEAVLYVVAQHTQYLPGVSPLRAETRSLTITLDPGATIDVRVVGSDAVGIEGAVTVIPTARWGQGRTCQLVGGQCSISGLRSGIHRLSLPPQHGIRPLEFSVRDHETQVVDWSVDAIANDE